MGSVAALPPGAELVRTTSVFDELSVPQGLLRAHKVADGVWGRLVVHSGELTFEFEQINDSRRLVGAGGTVVIPPSEPHHLELDGPVTFAVEFYKETS